MKYDKYFRVLRKYLWRRNNDVLEIEALLLGQKEQQPKDVPLAVFSEECTKYVTIPIPKINLPLETAKDSSVPYAFTLSIPDGNTTGGTFRGWGAVDLQTLRNDPLQVAQGAYSFVTGCYNKVVGSGSIAMVASNTINSPSGISIGNLNTIHQYNSIALGYDNILFNQSCTAIGQRMALKGSYSIGIGYFNNTEKGCLSIGSQNYAKGKGSSSIGYFNKMLTSNTCAVGYGHRSDDEISDVVDNVINFGYSSYNFKNLSNITTVGLTNNIQNQKSVIVGKLFDDSFSGAYNIVQIGIGKEEVISTPYTKTIGFGVGHFLKKSNNNTYFRGIFYKTYFLSGITSDGVSIISMYLGSYLDNTSISFDRNATGYLTFTVRAVDSYNNNAISFIGKFLATSDYNRNISIIGTPSIQTVSTLGNVASCSLNVIANQNFIIFNIKGGGVYEMQWNAEVNNVYFYNTVSGGI